MFGQEERRRSRCLNCALPCRFERDDFSCPMLVNFSSGGTGITGTEELPRENAHLFLPILRLAEEMELTPSVVWVHPETPGLGKASFGVEFAASPEETRRKLGDFFPRCMER